MDPKWTQKGPKMDPKWTHTLTHAQAHQGLDTRHPGLAQFSTRIIGSSDPELFVDQTSDLSTAKETVLLLDLLFLQTDSLFTLGIMDDLVQG